MINGVGVTVGVNVEVGKAEGSGVNVQPGGMLGKLGEIEQAKVTIASQTIKSARIFFFILVL